MALLNQSGKIVMLRVNEVGDSFGKPPDNFIAEVIVQLDTQPEQAASGFQLRDDANQPALLEATPHYSSSARAAAAAGWTLSHYLFACQT